jgi:Histidine kinase/Histidine kinase-, DNA gyrase B-, and HSP90-like ATPase
MSVSPKPPAAADDSLSRRWQALRAAAVRYFHAYGAWLVSISWWRFFLISILVLILAGITASIFGKHAGPHHRHEVVVKKTKPAVLPDAPASEASAAQAKGKVSVQIDETGVHISARDPQGQAAQLQIDEKGVRISAPADAPASAAQNGASAAKPGVDIQIGPNATEQEVEQALETVRRALEGQTSQHEDAVDVHVDADDGDVEHGDSLPNLAMLLILASLILKITYRGRIQAEAVAAAATQVAETESLKRQVMEARMAAMQAQMEPHFLFNTLAGIEHLIETDPPRAATMQKSLIAFLRATMPTLREANAQAERDLGRELAVVQPYLELMRMRMEERLQFDLQVPQGLRSARFPPMMLQSLVENAIRHGLEPQAEGGSITVRAEVQDGQLIVQVQDTGVGFAPTASTPGTTGGGIGLSNIRARLQLLYGAKASLQTSSPSTGGACVTITVPYQLGVP